MVNGGAGADAHRGGTETTSVRQQGGGISDLKFQISEFGVTESEATSARRKGMEFQISDFKSQISNWRGGTGLARQADRGWAGGTAANRVGHGKTGFGLVGRDGRLV